MKERLATPKIRSVFPSLTRIWSLNQIDKSETKLEIGRIKFVEPTE